MSNTESGSPTIEMWGGLEATVTRIRGEQVDQVRLSGHQDRPEDIDAFASLGIKAVRYPVIWERVAPNGDLDAADWRWTDERLGRLREHGVRPIAGLLHHGQGPRHTGLTDPDFATKFAEYAARVAERYPWIDAYTPINEPLTTARFCGLYGVWHPHARDHRTCLRILVNEIDATRRAMRAIRRINPRAQLIQTEDLGKAHSTPRLAYQAEFENERRWLTTDLLIGRVDRDHPLRTFFVRAGLERELDDLLADPCPPDIVGIDHYLTSERFLDERLDRYPDRPHGGNGRHRYADVEAVRVVAEGVLGFEKLAMEAWERYGLPIAATEVHNGCTREEQLRWLKEVWDSAVRLRTRGVDIRAVTAWALLGLYDWNSLLTRRVGHYEPGPFDLRGPAPRPTALARMMRDLAQNGDADHPTLDAPGWWHRPDRFFWPPVRSCPYTIAPHQSSPTSEAGGGRRSPRTLLIVGNGLLGRSLARLCAARGLPYHLAARQEIDLADPASVASGLDLHRPWAVVNAAGFTRPREAEAASAQCRRDNADAAAVLAEACASREIGLLGFSSHLVFDGRKRMPYVETDPVAPLNAYAASKAAADTAVLNAHPQALLIRAGAFFAPWDERNFLTRAMRALAAGREVAAVADETPAVSYLPHLIDAALDLLIDGERGLWHLANTGSATWAELTAEAARSARFDTARVRHVSSMALSGRAPRPSYSALGSDRGVLLPSVEVALRHYFEAWTAEPPRRPEAIDLIFGNAA